MKATARTGRLSTQAWVFTSMPEAVVIPPLLGAQVTGMAQGGMNITRFEEVDGALFAQSWWCRLE